MKDLGGRRHVPAGRGRGSFSWALREQTEGSMSMLYIGVDLGTSAVKLLLMDGAGKILNIVSREYPISFPRPTGCCAPPSSGMTAARRMRWRI